MKVRDKFVTKDIALKLINIGFEEDCLAQLANDELLYPKIFKKSIKRLEIIQLPLWQDVLEWFMVKHKLIITVIPFSISASDTTGYRFSYFIYDLNGFKVVHDETLLGFLTYNEAREQAIYAVILKILNVTKLN